MEARAGVGRRPSPPLDGDPGEALSDERRSPLTVGPGARPSPPSAEACATYARMPRCEVARASGTVRPRVRRDLSNKEKKLFCRRIWRARLARALSSAQARGRAAAPSRTRCCRGPRRASDPDPARNPLRQRPVRHRRRDEPGLHVHYCQLGQRHLPPQAVSPRPLPPHPALVARARATGYRLGRLYALTVLFCLFQRKSMTANNPTSAELHTNKASRLGPAGHGGQSRIPVTVDYPARRRTVDRRALYIARTQRRTKTNSEKRLQ